MDLLQSPELIKTGAILLMTIGAVNGLSIAKKHFSKTDEDFSSATKYGLSIVIAFALTFVPAELQNIFLEKAKQALEVAAAASGVYKLKQV